ncbi:methionyl-tRNA synthetase [Saccharata proteae CBS 121410]|uniref:methionine--tRNA ligase n=1 Tax=Saccharata proteae CBS 121410 TaxID=1314787 RepID=A0A9P4I2V1_9PEZI|nr:methionyl-tRNA synthetase [Saccharata proteae CBS 121410]
MSAAHPILPQEGKRNILITSALPYVNNIPHLGNIIGSVLSADVFSRFNKARGHPTLFICGSDEYGTATETKAIDEGLTPQELCDKYHQIHSDVYTWFNIKFDKFGRTPTQQQTDIAQDIFTKLYKNGYLEEKTTVQPYCEKHGSFLADRFVEGECSICHDDGARGDQCDKCGNLLDPLEPEAEPAAPGDAAEAPGEAKATGYLINPRCKLDGAAPVKRETKHIYLRLDELKGEIVEWFNKASTEGKWSSNCIQITQSWIDKGLKPRGITRDLKWGTPVPLPGYENKVMYVWFDACIGYVSITANYTDEWEKWWKNPDNVKLYQFMGKDNVQFHTIIFPGSQLGTKDKWTKVHHLSTTEYLNYEDTKFSKSKNIGVFGNSAKETGIPSDVWRYYLLSRRPETGDAEFKWNEFIDCNNNDLLKNLGNFVNRVVKFVAAKFDSVVPDYTKYTDEYLENYKKEANAILKTYIQDLEAVKLRKGLMTALHMSAHGNKLLQDNKLDNRLFAEEPERCAAVVGMALNHIWLLAGLMEPYMPATACGTTSDEGEPVSGIFQQLGVEPVPQIPETWTADFIKPGHKIGQAAYLFSQIKPEKEAEWRDLFGGEEAKRVKKTEALKKAVKKAAKDADKARKAARKAAAALAAQQGMSTGQGVEAAEKKQEADPAIEKVTEAAEKADLHTS